MQHNQPRHSHKPRERLLGSGWWFSRLSVSSGRESKPLTYHPSDSEHNDRGSVLLVSHRLPVMLTPGSNRLVWKSVGGVLSSLTAVQAEHDMLWIGLLGGGGGVPPDQQEVLRENRMVSVAVTAEDAERHYEGYATQVLWPVFHSMPQHMRYQRKDFEAYRRVNEAYAETIARYAGDQPIFINDYQLALVPGMLQREAVRSPIAFFLHIPFPTPEVLAMLPYREAILEGILGANLAGFQTQESMNNFVACVKQFLGVQAFGLHFATRTGLCRVGAFPIGVDFEHTQTMVQDWNVQQRASAIRREVGKKLVLAVDRVDYTKGIPLRLASFEVFLRRYPEWVGRVVLLQIAVPTREGIETFDALRAQIVDQVSRINAEWSSDGPAVDYRYGLLSPHELAAYYCAADVTWVSSIKDGMNLVAVEYASHRADNDGVLLLSRFAGAADFLSGAIIHNPWNIDEAAEGLQEAPEFEAGERSARMKRLRASAQRLDRKQWAKSLLTGACEERRGRQGSEGGVSWSAELNGEFARARHAHLLLDYDGTLTEIVSRPEQAAPTEPLLRLLAAFSELPGVALTVVSGRSWTDLQNWLAHLDIGLIAEHGLWHRPPGGNWGQMDYFAGQQAMGTARSIFEQYSRLYDGTWIENKTLGMAWHYREAQPPLPPERVEAAASYISLALASSPMRVLHGRKAIELVPVGVDKYTAARNVLPAEHGSHFVLAAGDDQTDEDLFRGLYQNAWTIKIGTQETWARYRLPDLSAMRLLLEQMLEARRKGLAD